MSWWEGGCLVNQHRRTVSQGGEGVMDEVCVSVVLLYFRARRGGKIESGKDMVWSLLSVKL